MEWTTIVSAVLGVIAVVFAVFWVKAKTKISQVYLLGKEALDVVKVAVDAIGDNAITPEEVESLKQEAAEVKAAYKALLGKE